MAKYNTFSLTVSALLGSLADSLGHYCLKDLSSLPLDKCFVHVRRGRKGYRYSGDLLNGGDSLHRRRVVVAKSGSFAENLEANDELPVSLRTGYLYDGRKVWYTRGVELTFI